MLRVGVVNLYYGPVGISHCGESPSAKHLVQLVIDYSGHESWIAGLAVGIRSFLFGENMGGDLPLYPGNKRFCLGFCSWSFAFTDKGKAGTDYPAQHVAGSKLPKIFAGFKKCRLSMADVKSGGR